MNDNKYNALVEQFLTKIEEADAVLVGAASGMSSAAGYSHYYERTDEFVEWCGDFEEKYGFHCSFDGAYYPYRTTEEKWAFYSRIICCILSEKTGAPYLDLARILDGKEFHILTTNQDTQFTHIYSEDKISAIQGDWRYMQCGSRCHDKLYDAHEEMKKLNAAITPELKIPTELIPRCPECGAEMEPWVRGPKFLEGKKYYDEYRKVQEFLARYRNKKLLLELGVGRMTPMFIQEPFWELTYSLPDAFYITINPKDALLPDAISHKGLKIKEDIAQFFSDAAAAKTASDTSESVCNSTLE